MQLVRQVKDNFFNEKNGRIKFTAAQRTAVLIRFNNKCNNCKCDIKKMVNMILTTLDLYQMEEPIKHLIYNHYVKRAIKTNA
jgi:hypothetical protein